MRGDIANGLDVDVTRVRPDGTNTMPSLDAAGRAGFVKVTDGTNTLPTMDAVARAGYQRLTDGTNAVTVGAGLVVDSSAKPIDVRLPQTKTFKRVAGTASSSGNNTVVAAPGASKVIKVLSYALQAQGTVNAKFTDGPGGSDLTLSWNFQAREGAYAQPHLVPQYHFKGTANTALVLNLSGAVSCGYEITYFDDDAS
jgi:hypothetical protein